MTPAGRSPEQVAEAIEQEHDFTGGPRQYFEAVGRETFLTLIQSGLLPNHNVLDFGCGAMRIGYWLVRFLDPDCYCGIEPLRERREAGVEAALTPELIEFKRPRFDDNSDADMSVFGECFDRVVARSIFTHMAPGAVRGSLESFSDNSTDGAVMFASYWRAVGEHAFQRGTLGDELPADDQRFLAFCKYSFDYLEALAESVGLRVRELNRPPINRQVWLRFDRA